MLQGIEKGKSLQTEIIRRALRVAVAVIALVQVTACSDSGMSDLHSYVRSVKARPAARIPPLPEFKMYETFTYSALDLRDPFALFENEAEIIGPETPIYSGPKPDENRNKETLEQYPLDTLRFVGQLEKDDDNWAIVTSPDKLVHRVKTGNYIGQNYGRITEISETEMKVIELVPDGMGGWIEREAALSLGN